MKKSEMIKVLNEIKGDPEILIWNGLAEDYMKISSIKSDFLYKEDDKFTLNILNLERVEQGLLPLEELPVQYKKKEWEFVNGFYSKRDIPKYYQKKTKPIGMIHCYLRNKSLSGRFGTIKY